MRETVRGQITISDLSDITVYGLLPNLTSVDFHSSGDGAAYSPASVGLYCGYTKTVGDGQTEAFPGNVTANLATSASGSQYTAPYNILYRTRKADGTWNGWGWARDLADGTLTIAGTTTWTGVEYVLTLKAASNVTEADIVGRVTIPVRKLSDGDTGIGSVTVDLTNEMGSIGCDSSGMTDGEQGVDTLARMWKGDQSLGVTGAMVMAPDGEVLSADYLEEVDPSVFQWSCWLRREVTVRGGVAQVTVYVADGYVFDDPSVVLTVRLTGSDGSVHDKRLTLASVRAGEDGQPATLYELLPSASEISVSPTLTGYAPSRAPLTVGYRRTIGGSTTSVSDATAIFGSSLRVWFRRRLRSTQSWESRYICYTGSGTGFSNARGLLQQLDTERYDKVELSISSLAYTGTATVDGVSVYYRASLSSYTDRETVPVVSDGRRAVALTASPGTLILEERVTAGEHSVDCSGAQAVLVVTDGGEDASGLVDGDTIVVTPNVSGGRYTSAARGYADTSTGQLLLSIGSINKNASNEFFSQGYVDVSLEYRGETLTVRVGWYVNMMGTWQETTLGDVNRALAQHSAWVSDELDGYVLEEDFGEYVRSASQNTSALTTRVSGVETAQSRIEQRVDLISLSLESGVKSGANLVPYSRVEQTGAASRFQDIVFDGVSSGDFVLSVQGRIDSAAYLQGCSLQATLYLCAEGYNMQTGATVTDMEVMNWAVRLQQVETGVATLVLTVPSTLTAPAQRRLVNKSTGATSQSMAVDSVKDARWRLVLRLAGNDSDQRAGVAVFDWLKLERGGAATAWVPRAEDASADIRLKLWRAADWPVNSSYARVVSNAMLGAVLSCQTQSMTDIATGLDGTLHELSGLVNTYFYVWAVARLKTSSAGFRMGITAGGYTSLLSSDADGAAPGTTAQTAQEQGYYEVGDGWTVYWHRYRINSGGYCTPVSGGSVLTMTSANDVGTWRVGVRGQVDLYAAGLTVGRKPAFMELTGAIEDYRHRRTGIDLESGLITVQADTFRIVNAGGQQTFSVDQDGNLVAAGTASVRNVRVSGHIFTPYTRLTSGNIGSYQMTNFAGDPVVRLDAAGNNLQVEVAGLTLRLPRITADMLGCEVNILNATAGNIEVTGSGNTANTSASDRYFCNLLVPSLASDLRSNSTVTVSKLREAKFRAIDNGYGSGDEHERYGYTWLCCCANSNP